MAETALDPNWLAESYRSGIDGVMYTYGLSGGTSELNWQVHMPIDKLHPSYIRPIIDCNDGLVRDIASWRTTFAVARIAVDGFESPTIAMGFKNPHNEYSQPMTVGLPIIYNYAKSFGVPAGTRGSEQFSGLAVSIDNMGTFTMFGADGLFGTWNNITEDSPEMLGDIKCYGKTMVYIANKLLKRNKVPTASNEEGLMQFNGMQYELSGELANSTL